MTAFALGVQRAAGRTYFLVPAPALSMLEGLLLDELPAFILPVAVLRFREGFQPEHVNRVKPTRAPAVRTGAA